MNINKVKFGVALVAFLAIGLPVSNLVISRAFSLMNSRDDLQVFSGYSLLIIFALIGLVIIYQSYLWVTLIPKSGPDNEDREAQQLNPDSEEGRIPASFFQNDRKERTKSEKKEN